MISLNIQYVANIFKDDNINLTNNDKLLGKYGTTGTFTDCWWELKILQPLWNILAVSYTIKHLLTIQYSNSTLKYLPKINESICAHEHLYAYACSSFINKSQESETTQMFIDRSPCHYPINIAGGNHGHLEMALMCLPTVLIHLFFFYNFCWNRRWLPQKT